MTTPNANRRINRHNTDDRRFWLDATDTGYTIHDMEDDEEFIAECKSLQAAIDVADVLEGHVSGWVTVRSGWKATVTVGHVRHFVDTITEQRARHLARLASFQTPNSITVRTGDKA